MSTKEIHTLRRKFIGISMLSFFLVILLIGTLINASNYAVEQLEIMYSLSEILDKKYTLEENDTLVSELEEHLSITQLFSPSYQRNIFYIFTYDKHGNIISFTASRGNTYREDVIADKAISVMNTDRDSGRQGMYCYKKNYLPNGNIELALMDCTYITYTRARLLYASIGVGLLGLLASFILVLIWSRRAIEPEIRNNEKQIQFLTNVSHELKTPLAVIQSNAEMEELTIGENEFTKSTIRQVNRMNGLIKSLIMISKTKEKSDDNLNSTINISDIATETLREFHAMATGENKTLTSDIDNGLTISSSESTIRQLLMILIDNAIKYCDDGGTVTVSLKPIRRGRKHVKLIVSNNYKDGEHTDYTLFFDRFYREDSSRNIDTSGYGIGLSIAQNICEQNNGNISAGWSDGVISFVCELV